MMMTSIITLVVGLVLSPVRTDGASQAQPSVISKIGTPDSGAGDGHLLPGWSDDSLQKRAADIQLGGRDAELRARSILAELDQAFVEVATGRPKISISRKISELDYQIARLQGRLAEADGMLSTKSESIFDRARLQGLKASISDVKAEMLANRVYFERQYARARLMSASRASLP